MLKMEEIVDENITHPPTSLPESTTPTAKIICEILFRESPQQIAPALASTGLVPTPDVVTEVLNLSYDYPFSAVKFFRWAGLVHKHSPRAWNLMVDLLGRNRLFDSMWDAIRSMRHDSTLTLSTFALAFSNYCAAARFDDAVSTFHVVHKYGVPQDSAAANSLLAAMCQNCAVSRALDFLDAMKSGGKGFALDGDSYAILIEALEKEGDLVKAKAVVGEMAATVGWDRRNMAAYEDFLTAMVKAEQTEEAVGFLKLMNKNGCLPGKDFLSNAVDIITKQKCVKNAVLVWDVMVGSGLLPDLRMYNSIIGFLCDCNEVEEAFRMLDEMVLNGAFPDSVSYNVIFKCLIKNTKVREAGRFFMEMVKNECVPTHFNFAAAIAMFFDEDDPEMGVEMWEFMVENRVEPLDVAANALLLGLCKLDRLSELKRNADDMLDRRISIYESTMASLKSIYYKNGRGAKDKYDALAKRWKTSKAH